MSLNQYKPATENAAIHALRDKRRKVVDSIGLASKELAYVAAQHGRRIDSYQVELRQIDDAIAVLSPAQTPKTGVQECGQTDAPLMPYN